MRLAYKAFDKAGKEVVGELEATGHDEAADKLRQQNLYVAELTPLGESKSGKKGGWRLPQSKVRRLRDLAMFTRQLYSLVHAGMPLAQGLDALERQAQDPRWRAVIQDVRARLERGSALSDALAAHPDYFDKIYTSMITAGESSGKLAILLDRLAALTRKRVHVLSVIRGAMVYPILLATVATGVLAVMLLFVVPRFGELFQNIGATLPPTTAFLISLSEGLRAYWWAVGAGAVIAVIGLKRYLRSQTGRTMVDTVVLRVPKVGRIIKAFATARIARLLGVLTDSHLPIQDILRLTGSTTSNCHYAALLGRAEAAVGHGESISSAFRDSSLISPTVYEAIRSGEQSGQVGPLLLDLADFMDEENEITLKSLTSIIEPVLLVLMGVMVGFVAMSIFLPLFDVTGMMGGGK